jgi:tRNA(adenine34) deaminase
MDTESAECWMREAMLEARKAEAEGEVPVGAVLLVDGKIFGRGHNSSIQLHDPTAHAEIAALRQASRNIMNYRLPGSVLIVTMEPCIMCVGAMIQARVEEVIFGAADLKAGAIHSCFRLAEAFPLNHKIRVMPGILESDCSALLKKFFSARR